MAEVLPFLRSFDLNELPTTRYQGSKSKIAFWIWENIKDIAFDKVLDGFGGTGVISYLFKKQGKEVTYNDYLKFNAVIARAIIENKETKLSGDEIKKIVIKEPRSDYESFISEVFDGIYYKKGENVWLDVAIQNITRLLKGFKQDLAFYGLFQACIIKRPYNLFHRKNLYIRESEVDRSFGNKTTWDRPFEEHFFDFAKEGNLLVFDNGRANRALCYDIMVLTGDYDLVYLDPPYTSRKGVSVNYYDFYHFLEGITGYYNWPSKIDYKTKHRRLKKKENIWNDKKRIFRAFAEVIEKFSRSIIVISYRSDGLPPIEYLYDLLKRFKGHVKVASYENYRYVLSNSKSAEVLLIGY